MIVFLVFASIAILVILKTGKKEKNLKNSIKLAMILMIVFISIFYYSLFESIAQKSFFLGFTRDNIIMMSVLWIFMMIICIISEVILQSTKNKEENYSLPNHPSPPPPPNL
jgi:membrane protease YdiL (CAAX protease family)